MHPTCKYLGRPLGVSTYRFKLLRGVIDLHKNGSGSVFFVGRVAGMSRHPEEKEAFSGIIGMRGHLTTEQGQYERANLRERDIPVGKQIMSCSSVKLTDTKRQPRAVEISEIFIQFRCLIGP